MSQIREVSEEQRKIGELQERCARLERAFAALVVTLGNTNILYGNIKGLADTDHDIERLLAKRYSHD